MCALPTLNHRTVAVIQKKMVKRGVRNIFRHFFRSVIEPRDDENLVATWRSDLDKIRRTFEVGSSISV